MTSHPDRVRRNYAEAVLSEPEGLTKEEEDFVEDFCSDEEPKYPGIQRVSVCNTDDVKSKMICEDCGHPVSEMRPQCESHDLKSG